MSEFDRDDQRVGGASHVFIENERLIRAINRFHGDGDSHETREAVVRSVVASTLLVPVPKEQQPPNYAGDDGKVVLQAEMEVSFLTLADEDGGVVVPLFTDEGALAAYYGEGAGYIAMSAQDLFPMFANQPPVPGAVVNPGTQEAFYMPPQWVQGLAEDVSGTGAMRIGEQAEVMVGFPAEPMPVEMRNEISLVCAEEGYVAECWEFIWFIPGQMEHPTLVLAVSFDRSALPVNVHDDGPARRFWSVLEPIFVENEWPATMVDIDDYLHVFGELKAQTEPIFFRKRAA